ncbi:C40 family peptidase [Planotetraspora sp. A-T 1434]|uniref:C40 family peptidase n=1 Tax=Planotetraspora sp. A-T 1434 TaxID=2979219 RepID=UPI0021C18CCF|nr:C40 family peptidase [Planotetraspora sp. A-T 1434]MCT9935327.1 C40 family peptidase [Planotetraspora sp. A-T 1434]
MRPKSTRHDQVMLEPLRSAVTSRRFRWRKPLIAALIVIGAALACGFAWRSSGGGELTFERYARQHRTIVRDGDGRTLAMLTDGARTVVFIGVERTFAEPKATGATVTTRAHVRLAPRPWHSGAEREDWFTRWFAAARNSQAPDVLDIAAQYLDGAPTLRDGKGLRYAGEADYGPQGDDERVEAADFNDYLGVRWTYGRFVREPRSQFHNSMDCSGFLRMVYGYRSGYPLEFKPATGRALPRRAIFMAEKGPGVVIVPDRHRRATDYTRLQPGDLLFFNVSPNDGDDIDHSAIYLGLDSQGHHRFISSRKTANGPTMGDIGGRSVLDSRVGLYGQGFRAARRL